MANACAELWLFGDEIEPSSLIEAVYGTDKRLRSYRIDKDTGKLELLEDKSYNCSNDNLTPSVLLTKAFIDYIKAKVNDERLAIFDFYGKGQYGNLVEETKFYEQRLNNAIFKVFETAPYSNRPLERIVIDTIMNFKDERGKECKDITRNMMLRAPPVYLCLNSYIEDGKVIRRDSKDTLGSIELIEYYKNSKILEEKRKLYRIGKIDENEFMNYFVNMLFSWNKCMMYNLNHLECVLNELLKRKDESINRDVSIDVSYVYVSMEKGDEYKLPPSGYL